MPALFEPERLKRIRDTVAESWTPLQFQTRKETTERLLSLIATCTDDAELYSRLHADFPVWCVAFLDDDSGKPLFPAPWQIEFAAHMEDTSYEWALCTRKCGKSTILAAILAHIMCGATKERVSVFAPTHGQDFVYRKARKYLTESPYLKSVFIDAGGNTTGDSLITSTGSELINRSISISTGGGTIRGEHGSRVVVDEVQEIGQDILDTVVFPIIADAYSKKHLAMIGTPNLYKNPELENRWIDWQRRSLGNSEYGFFTVDCWRAVKEGCMQESWILDQKSAMTPDDFAMEYLAQFPDSSLRFYPMNLLDSLRTSGLTFRDSPRNGYAYVMAVDWAKYDDRTQILIGEIDRKAKVMRYAHWIMIDPRERRMDYAKQVLLVKELYHRFGCEWFCPDTTSNQDALVDMLTSGNDGISPIPRGHFYGYDGMASPDNQKLGYKATAISNFEMHRNHKEQMNRNRLRLPVYGSQEMKFTELYTREHHELQAKPISGGALVKLEEQPGGKKDLAVCAAMLSLYMLKLLRSPPSLFVA